jgi:hypothetical protein
VCIHPRLVGFSSAHLREFSALSDKEERAIELVDRLRSQELVSLWHDDPYKQGSWLGMPFTESKSIIDQSRLFHLIKQVIDLLSLFPQPGW